MPKHDMTFLKGELIETLLHKDCIFFSKELRGDLSHRVALLE